jgi:transcriptional regulator with XRE-family HTH domain
MVMSTAISAPSEPDTGQPVAVHSTPVRRRLHRLAEVRQQEGVTRRAIAVRLGLSPQEVLQQEKDSDLLLSTLYAWQEALNVPASEFLVEGDSPLSTPVLRRAGLLRMMKTIMSIAERSKQASIRRLARFLAAQLVEVMPELKEVTPWPAVGKRRTTSELGQAAFRRFASAVAIEFDHEAA